MDDATIGAGATARGMGAVRLARIGLLVVQLLVGVTAIAGGAALVLGALVPALSTVLVPPTEYLEGSPFGGYLVPGLLLAAVVGGVHVAAGVLTLRRHRWWLLAGAVAGFGMLIWIFVQMVVIPFSVLQAVYFVLGVAECSLVMLALGVLRPRRAGDPAA
jgi:hypothetical protein